MVQLSLKVELIVDEVRRKFWSQLPFRLIQLRVTVSNNGRTTAQRVTFEFLLPAEILLDFPPDSWRPSHRHDVDGTIYDAFESWNGGYGSRSASPVELPAGAHFSEKLAVNVKSDAQTASLLWRLYDGDAEYPADNWGREALTFKAHVEPS